MRRFLRNLPIKQKLMAITMTISGVALLLACAAFAFYEQAAFRRAMARDFTILADMFDDNVASGLAFNDPASIEQTLETLSANQRIVAACVYDKQGTVVALYRRPGAAGDAFHFPPVQPTGQRFTPERLNTFKDIELAGEVIGVVYISTDLTELRERAWRYIVIVGLLLAGCSLVALGLAARLQRIISQPIVDLAQTVATVTTGKNYTVRAHKQSDDELGRLIDGFNEMLAEIQVRDSALESARAHLEIRVEERTRELQRENAERKAAEMALRESEERFSGAFEFAPIGVALVAPDGRWLKVNRALCDLVGYSEAELLTRTFQDITYAEDLPGDLEHVQQLLAGTISSYQMEKRYVHAHGDLVPVLLNVSLVRDGQGRPRYFISQIQDITSRKQAEARLADTHLQLLATSRQAGMAEVATGVLHNVGNVLNSVNVSATLVADQVRHTKAGGIAKLAAMFAEHQADLADFLTRDARGQMIPAYLGSLVESLAAEHAAMLKELDHLRKNIEHIKDIVAMQQSFARNAGFIETVALTDLVEDALRMNANSLVRHDVELVREYEIRPSISTDKHKIVQVLINLVRNAKHACDATGRPDKRIVLRIAGDTQRVRISVTDNGIGIPPENLVRVFSHGFTTKKDGHGFGLHSGALAAKELGGSLSAQSAGAGLGATFTLELPLQSDSRSAAVPADPPRAT